MAPRKRKNNKRKQSKNTWRKTVKKVGEALVLRNPQTNEETNKESEYEVVNENSSSADSDYEMVENMDESINEKGEIILKENKKCEECMSENIYTNSVDNDTEDEHEGTYEESDYDISDFYDDISDDAHSVSSSENNIVDSFEPVNAVIRGIITCISEEDIMEVLKDMHFNPIAVHRMISRESWNPMPLVLVQVPKYEKDRLFRQKEFVWLKLQMSIKVEEHGPGYKISQCSKCKKFGHVKNDCDILSSLSKTPESPAHTESTEDLGIGNTYSSDHSKASDLPLSPSYSNHSTSSKKDGTAKTRINDTMALWREQCQIFLDKMAASGMPKHDLNLVLKGLPVEIKTRHILEDLISKGFSVKNVYRLKDDNDVATEELAFQLPKNEDHIFYLSCCLGFKVSVENYIDDFARVEEHSVSVEHYVELSMKKPVKLLIRGIPATVPEEDVIKDLKTKHFMPVGVHRLVKPVKRGHIPIPLVLAEMHREEKYINKLKCVLGFPVTVEPFLKHIYPVQQCQACQKFGHSKSDCAGNKHKPVKDLISQNISEILNVVIKGVPLKYQDDGVILRYLTESGFLPIAIHRMVANGEILPMYLVQVPKDEKRILHFSCCLGFNVTVENYNPNLYPIDQCSYCRDFGHTEDQCNVMRDEESEDKIKENCNKESGADVTEKAKSLTEYCRRLSQSETKSLENDDNKFAEDDETNTSENPTRTQAMREEPLSESALNRPSQEINGSQNTSTNLLINMGKFDSSFEVDLNDTDNISPLIKCVLHLQELSMLYMPFLDINIATLRTMTDFMMNVSYVPGVTSHKLNEQLHDLEELEEIKQQMKACPGPLTPDYDVNFPKLNTD